MWCKQYMEEMMNEENEKGWQLVNVMFALKVLMRKFKEGQKELHCVFVGQRDQMISSSERNCGK